MRAPTLSFIIALGLLQSSHAESPSRPEKKLIHAGYSGTTEYLRANVRQIEELPFDGLNISLDWSSDAFVHEAKRPPDHYANEQEDLLNTAWETFTDRFIIVKAADKKSDMDWFSDDHWENICHNIAIVARVARDTGCRGLTFDPEQYHTHIWDYRLAPRNDEFSFEEYRAMTRKRGAQFIEAIQAVMPSTHILNYFQMTTFWKLYGDPEAEIEDTNAWLAKAHYGLYLGFIEGMVEAAGPEVRLIDGNEGSYGYIDKADYDAAYTDIMQRCLHLVDPGLRDKYRQNVRVGAAVYLNHCFGKARVVGAFLPAGMQPKLLEHNVYHALDSTDRYAWFYLETSPHSFWRQVLPAGTVAAIEAARERHRTGNRRALADPAFKEARAALRDFQANAMNGVEPATAKILKIRAGTAAPVIDGNLDDPAWAATPALAPFTVRVADMVKGSEAPTTAQVTWNNEKIFIAFTCMEPKVKQMHSSGPGTRDSDVWRADCVEIFLLPGLEARPYHQFVVNPKNTQFDLLSEVEGEPPNLDWNATWESATQVLDDRWIAEFAIPWSAAGGTPDPGERRRANLGRGRAPAPRETSSWSPMWDVYADMQYAGTFVFE